jgi:hypothetical protein
MAVPIGPQKRLLSRRQFLTLAGAGAVVGAFILFATKNKGISGLLKTNAGTQTNQATAGKFVTTRTATSPLTSQSFFQRLFGGKL